MKQLFFTLSLFLCTITPLAAKTQPAIIFSQDVIAINADGSEVPPVKIDPQEMAGMQTHDFDLGRDRLLRINTNISNAGERGLNDLADTVKRCYSYVEATTGYHLNRGIMLYLIELDEIPYAYTFRAAYDNASQWGEVRLALVDRAASLSGQKLPIGLSDLLYDTLPHELGHDVLAGIPQLLHDIDGDTSHHTRWFIEGACEMLAKGFSGREVPALNRHYLSLRNVDTVLAENQRRTDLLSWTQDNDNGMAFESDLYGAAMLTMMTWTESITLNKLLEQLATRSEQVRGIDLLTMMQETTGIGSEEMFNRAHEHGRRLNEKVVLAQLEIE
jgi:hypothetical protein